MSTWQLLLILVGGSFLLILGNIAALIIFYGWIAPSIRRRGGRV